MARVNSWSVSQAGTQGVCRHLNARKRVPIPAENGPETRICVPEFDRSCTENWRLGDQKSSDRTRNHLRRTVPRRCSNTLIGTFYWQNSPQISQSRRLFATLAWIDLADRVVFGQNDCGNEAAAKELW